VPTRFLISHSSPYPPSFTFIMFSPDTTLHTQSGSSGRNPRRRQRKDSDSFRQAPQRKRSKLSDETFVPPTNGKVNGNGSIGVNGYTPYGHSSNHSHTLEMPLREKKSSGVTKRAPKGDGSIVLVRTLFINSFSAVILTDTSADEECKLRPKKTREFSRPFP
jgi:hypothetical protein